MSRRRAIAAATAALAGLAVLVGAWGVAAGDVLIVGAAVLIGIFALLCGALLVLWVLRSLAAAVARDRKQLSAELAAVRKKQSTHEYVQEQALSRLEHMGAGVRSDVEALLWERHPLDVPALEFRSAGPGAPRVLFVTSNGGGMGHLTRLMAVAKRADGRFRSAFLTLSSAYHVVERQGFEVAHYVSHGDSPLSADVWNRRFSRYFAALIAKLRPDAIVYDGAWMYRTIHEVAERSGTPLAWFCRGLWKDTANRSQLRRSQDLADVVIVPGEGMLVPTDDTLAELQGALRVSPITLVDAHDALPRLAAARELGLDDTRNHVLIQLGAGNINDIVEIRDVAVRAVLSLGPEWVPVVSTSPLSRDSYEPPEGVVHIREYPVSRLARAFEFAVVAAGYNTVHEMISLQQPAVIVPNTATLTDDQRARAVAVAEAGMGFCAQTEDELVDAIRELSSPATRDRVRTALDGARLENGAHDAAKAIGALALSKRGRSGTAVVSDGAVGADEPLSRIAQGVSHGRSALIAADRNRRESGQDDAGLGLLTPIGEES
ncbi:glycosyltransferase [Georgenia sp. AZ-5]|uniref:glycosyltransferase n=1 Tax=Georgenia sp. AZ-5 TaxID=3367526 RepID=UPI00375504BF